MLSQDWGDASTAAAAAAVCSCLPSTHDWPEVWRRQQLPVVLQRLRVQAEEAEVGSEA